MCSFYETQGLITTNQIHSLNYILMKNIKSQSVAIFSDNYGAAIKQDR